MADYEADNLKRHHLTMSLRNNVYDPAKYHRCTNAISLLKRCQPSMLNECMLVVSYFLFFSHISSVLEKDGIHAEFLVDQTIVESDEEKVMVNAIRAAFPNTGE